MKVVILGGYGVFGSRLATLLCRDGHRVWIAGRSLDKAASLAETLGAEALHIDLHRGLDPILATGAQVVVDAAGPFQSYGSVPYQVAEFCIQHGMHYLDLSDSSGFTSGIAALDAAAQKAKVICLSGVSSVPALSSAVVSELSAGMDRIEVIDTAILPGNRAPRGHSVIAAIVGQLGQKARVWRGCTWHQLRVWSARRRITLSPGLTRTAHFIPVPDLDLFPAFFGARAVMFRAGMELPMLNHALTALAWLRRVWPFALTARRTGLIRALANLLRPLGTDVGGMRVRVVGTRGGETHARLWTLIAQAGDGPFVPAIAARTILRDLDRIPVGARACLAEAPLADHHRAMSDLAIRTDIQPEGFHSLFETALGRDWHRLPPCMQALHRIYDLETFAGHAEVNRGNSPIARIIAVLFRFPPSGQNVPLRVTKTREPGGEIWVRQFADRAFRSRLSAAHQTGRVMEAFGPFRFALDLPVSEGVMHLSVRRGWCFGIPIPRPLLPVSESREYQENGTFRFDVALHAPLRGGLIVRYRGHLRPETQDPGSYKPGSYDASVS